MTTLWLFGCGKMGSSMLDAWQQNSFIHHYVIIDHKAKTLPANEKCSYFETLSQAIKAKAQTPDIFIIAIKPNQIEAEFSELKPFFKKYNPLILSVIAGKKISFYEKNLGNAIRFIRAMPNTPCAIGQGIIGLVANGNITEYDQSFIDQMMLPLGGLVWLKDEAMIDKLTAISGSGPAYLFLFAEALTKAAIQMGFDPRTAEILANQTLLGSAALLSQSPLSAKELRENVTSPGGTTAKAIEVFTNEKDTLFALVQKATEACFKRAKELSEE